MSTKIFHKNIHHFTILILIGVLAFSKAGYSQNAVETTVTLSIPSFALIDFQGDDHFITFKSPTQVEQIITPSSLNQIWLNYSSIVESGFTNYITVHISSGSLPPESSIELEIGGDAGAGMGKLGTPTSQITLSRYPQNIINGIGSCYTGRGAEKGHQLKYSWINIANYSEDLQSKKDFEITVTYTITSTE